MDEIKYEYKFQDIDFLGTAQFLYDRHPRWPNLWPIIILVSSFFLVLSIFRVSQMDFYGAQILFPWILICSVSIAYTLIRARESKGFARAVEQAPWHQGVTKVTLSQDGICTIHASGEVAVSWGFITEVVTDLPESVLFLMSPADYIPCPDTSLPSDLTRAALLEQIAEWRKAAA